MKKLYILITILIIIGVIFVMVNKNKNNSTRFDSQDIKVNVTNGELISKEKVKDKFDPSKSSANRNKQTNDFSLNLDDQSKGNNKEFLFEVKNTSDMTQTIQFGTSQRYDYEIIDETGQAIYRYSDGRSFMQVLKTISLEPNDSISYEIVLPNLAAGNYKLSIVLAAKRFNLLKQTIEFTVD